MSWSELLAEASSRLEDRHEARVLVEEAAGRPLASLLLDKGGPADGERAQLEAALARRVSGEPLQHVVGHWSFRRLELVIDGRALVPRPETEVVAGRAIDALVEQRRPDERLVAVDLGTGSGAIACALVDEVPEVDVIAVDHSAAALELAAENRARLGASAWRLELRRASWYAALETRWDHRVHCVVANPPYLAEDEWQGLDPVVRDFDPYDSLVAGPGGLEAITEVIAGAPRLLIAGGTLVVELAPHQADAAGELAAAAGAHHVEIGADLVGRARVLVARW